MRGGGHDDAALAKLRALGEPARAELIRAMTGTAFVDDVRFACAWALVLAFPTPATLASVTAHARSCDDAGVREVLLAMARTAARARRSEG